MLTRMCWTTAAWMPRYGDRLSPKPSVVGDLCTLYTSCAGACVKGRTAEVEEDAWREGAGFSGSVAGEMSWTAWPCSVVLH